MTDRAEAAFESLEAVVALERIVEQLRVVVLAETVRRSAESDAKGDTWKLIDQANQQLQILGANAEILEGK